MAISNYDENNLKAIILFFKNKGLNDFAICGVLGNWYPESGFRPNNLQNSYNTKYGLSDAQFADCVESGEIQFYGNSGAFGYGLAQWTSKGRRNGLYTYLKNRDLRIDDLNGQLEYAWSELNGSYKSVLKVLKAGESIDACARKFMLGYEKPASQTEANQLKRVGYAQEFYDKYFDKEEKSVIATVKFKPRTTKPTTGDKYLYLYNNASNGGLSKCIKGKPMDVIANVLSNCVGYACGRFNEVFNEITGNNGIKFASLNCNAENFVERAKSYGLVVGQVPQVGAIMCWQKGKTLGSSDGAGHVAVVEQVKSPTSVICSESGYNSYDFRTKTRSGSNFGCSSAYKFRGFIYNPALYDNPYPMPTTTLKKGSKGDEVKWLQYELVKHGYVIAIDNSFGGKTETAVKQYQKDHKLTVDGKVGAKTRVSLLS